MRSACQCYAFQLHSGPNTTKGGGSVGRASANLAMMSR